MNATVHNELQIPNLGSIHRQNGTGISMVKSLCNLTGKIQFHTSSHRVQRGFMIDRKTGPVIRALRTRTWETRVQVPAPQQTSCETLGKSVGLFVPQLLICKMGIILLPLRTINTLATVLPCDMTFPNELSLKCTCEQLSQTVKRILIKHNFR